MPAIIESIPFGISPKIESIREELDNKLIFDSKRLKKLSRELCEISDEIEALPSPSEFFQKDKEQVISLIGRCHNLMIDSEVTEVAEAAEMLASRANKVINIAQKVDELQQKVDNLVTQHALSLENRKMILLANKYLNSIDEKMHVKEEVKKDKIIPFSFSQEERIEIAETLYAFSTHLYQGSVNQALCIFNQIPKSHLLDIEREIPTLRTFVDFLKSNTSINQEFTDKTMAILREIVFYVERIHSANTSENLPSEQAIHLLFKELSALN